MHGHHSLAAKTLSALPRPGFRGGGLIRGPGTGTSDSIPAEMPPGTYILPKDTTEATGLAARALGDVPVAVSNGEYEVTPEQLQAMGAMMLDFLRGVTHMPVEVEDEQAEGGQEEPGDGREGYANGGQVAPGYRMDAAADPRSTVYGSNDPYAASNAVRMLGLADSIGSRGVMELGRAPAPQPPTARNSFGDAAAATVDPMVTQLPQFRRPGFADGGLVTDEERRQNLVSQIPAGGMTAPAADGSQNNPLNNEVGRNALNTLSALPGASGFASRGAATTARGIGGATAAVERAAPATWEVVEGGASAARAATPTGGALTRAASVAPEISATGFSSRTAQMLGSPGGQIAERGASEVGQALPSAGRSARGFTPYADVVEPLALSAPSASQAAGAAAQGARGFGPMSAAGGAAGLGAASLVSGDSSAGSPPAAAPSTPGVNSAISAPPRAQAADAPMGPPMSASNSITRDGNSYSGPANLSGDVSIRNPDGSLRAPAALSTVPGGGISAQNMGAADALASRENAASLGRLGLAGGAPGFSGVIGQQGNGNMWTRTPDQQRQDALTQASSIDRGTAARGAAALNAMDAQALQGVKNQADIGVAQLQDQGMMNRTLITERGNNTRAAIDAQGRVTAAGIKAAQEAALARQKQAEKNPETSMALRKEFEGLPEVKNYKQALPAFKGIEDAVKRDTPMSDINLVYGIAKLYDPNSVVREGEYATVANAPGMPDRVKGWVNYVSGGGKLTADVKKQIMDEANSRMLSFQNEFEGTQKRYNDIAARSGADPTLVTVQGYQPAVKPTSTAPGQVPQDIQALLKKYGG